MTRAVCVLNTAGSTPARPSLYNVEQYYGLRHVATIAWQLPFPLARSIKRREEINNNHPKGTYFKLK